MAVGVTEKKLYRVVDGAYVGGVCAGLAEYYELDTIVVRILAVLIAMLTFGIGIIAYLILWARVPVETERSGPYDVTPESAESTAFGCVDLSSNAPDRHASGISIFARLAVAVGLMAIFLLVSTGVSPLVPGTDWWQFWPLVFLMLGLCLIVIPIRTRFEAAWHAAGIVLTSFSASILPMSLGIISWATIGCAVETFWPLLVGAVALLGIGIFQKRDAYMLGVAIFLVAFCVAGLMMCAVPGEIETFLLYMPTGRMFRIDVMM